MKALTKFSSYILSLPPSLANPISAAAPTRIPASRSSMRSVYILSRYWVRSGRPSFKPLRFLVSWTI